MTGRHPPKQALVPGCPMWTWSTARRLSLRPRLWKFKVVSRSWPIFSTTRQLLRGPARLHRQPARCMGLLERAPGRATFDRELSRMLLAPLHNQCSSTWSNHLRFIGGCVPRWPVPPGRVSCSMAGLPTRSSTSHLCRLGPRRLGAGSGFVAKLPEGNARARFSAPSGRVAATFIYGRRRRRRA